MANPKDGKLELLSDKNSALVLVDYQRAMFAGVASGDKTIIRNSAYCAAKAATILNIPVVLTTINPEHNGNFSSGRSPRLFPGQEAISRSVLVFDAFEDDKVWTAFRKTGRKTTLSAGLWTSMCFAYTALHAIREGYEVYGLIDAGGDSTADAHRYGIERMLAGWRNSDHDRIADIGMDARLG